MNGGGVALGNRLAPPRFVMFLVLLMAGLFGFRHFGSAKSMLDAAAMAFDLAAVAFLLSLVPLVRDAEVADLRRHAADNDANRALVLAITTIVTMVVMAAISGELPRASGGDRIALAKLIGTLALTWLFANAVYALHYAHLFYTSKDGKDAQGVDFPDTDTPDYLDFAYFSFTLGMTFQTSDVEITSREVRHIATLHSFAAFVFNIGVIAFTINALG